MSAPGGTSYHVLTRAELRGFDEEATELVMTAIGHGCLGRLSSKGHVILRSPTGETTAIPRNMSAQNRTAQNARAAVKRLLREPIEPPATEDDALGSQKARARTQTQAPRRLTVNQAFRDHGAAFASWYATYAAAHPLGLPAGSLLEVDLDDDAAPTFLPVVPDHVPEEAITMTTSAEALAEPRAVETEVVAERLKNDSVPPEAHHPKHGSTAATTSPVGPEEILRRVREALGEDPRLAALAADLAEARAEIEALNERLAAQTALAEEASHRLVLIQEVFSV